LPNIEINTYRNFNISIGNLYILVDVSAFNSEQIWRNHATNDCIVEICGLDKNKNKDKKFNKNLSFVIYKHQNLGLTVFYKNNPLLFFFYKSNLLLIHKLFNFTLLASAIHTVQIIKPV
jgi:hypothetical protein